MKQFILKFIAAFWGNSLIHGAIMAAGGAIGLIVYSLAESWVNDTAFQLPTWQRLLKAAVGAALLYICKNGTIGSSAPKVG